MRWEGLKEVGGQHTKHVLQGLGGRVLLTFRMFESINFWASVLWVPFGD